uniref:WGS project CAEQ00000000 data, annotated contig 1420 n=1 Tax=Trypanosoma congolense (strain IL3000) TaxID=1068625 RepID=F9W635_TRYCI|nr:unnamed protein product [Trypanosoma congolense IL3000]
MEEIVNLCTLCTSGEEQRDASLGLVLAFMLHRTAQIALLQMSAIDRGSLALRLISAGGLQQEHCRHFLFTGCCPPYDAALLMRLSYELYLKPMERITMLGLRNAVEESPLQGKHSMPLLSLLRTGRGGERSQPPVDFRGADVVELLSALVESWDPGSSVSLTLRELPPGFATFLVLHYPMRTLATLQKHAIEPFVLSSWCDVWCQLFVDDGSIHPVSLLHVALTRGVCGSFWPGLRQVLLDPLIGCQADVKVEDDDERPVLEAPTILAAHAVLRLWLGELQRLPSALKEGEEFSASGGAGGREGSLFGLLLAKGLWLVECDGCGRRDVDLALRAAYALLLVLYNGQCMASQVVRHALDHPSTGLFVPSLFDLEIEDRSLLEELGMKTCGLAFLTALALRLPVAQLYVASRIWKLLELVVTSGDGGEEDVVELHSRLLVLLGSFGYTNLRLESNWEGDPTAASASQLSPASPVSSAPKSEEMPRLALRLKRNRTDEFSPQSTVATGGSDVRSTGVNAPPLDRQNLALAASLLCQVLIEFSQRELSQLLILTSTSPASVAAAVPPEVKEQFATRLILATPSHMKGFIDLLSSSSSPVAPPCLVNVHNVSCVLMSVLLYRWSAAVCQSLLSEEVSDEAKVDLATQFTRCIRRWGRFLAPLGLFRYAPVVSVMLPQCVRLMEEKGSPEGVATSELCGVLKTFIVERGT